MNTRKLRIAFHTAVAVALIVFARLCVSMGRLIYAVYTGVNVTGGDPAPQWQELLFGDVFFYIGLAALITAIICRIRLKRA